ncbi:prolyl oligopeptidase family serine peptidase [Kitasatospora sp. NBC_01287]|uniref:S9 family peptidase n=1 Tax=Kitasatospora sp. NBC_01287 TaxID=2903573 RepID=UPI00224EFA18|nr:prolyl oligopeptidase family serine peptidase [Kitasatospora sp. NBC_01287]MCX4746951.1 prolyl oligopeptidase family serine peptidase [Kitasatospora sp. NBC_01287]
MTNDVHPAGTAADSFPRQYARTQRYTVGRPRSFAVAPDDARVVFLRSRSGGDRANLLWTLDPATGAESVAADPAALLGGGEEDLSPAERARRERSRESSAGIVGYTLDAAGECAAFALSGRLFAADLVAGGARELPAAGPLLDPRLSPDGRWVAYPTTAGALRLTAVDGSGDRALAEPEAAGVTWGQAEFIAQEEMDRDRGHWWSPDSGVLLVARADEAPVQRWWIADPANPATVPTEVAYPAAGTPNAEVTLWLLGLDGSRTEVVWDRAAHPYLARVHWSADGPPLLLVQARDQRSQLLLSVDLATGATSELLAERDDAWLELFHGVPAWSPDGRLVRISDEPGHRALFAGEVRLTDDSLHLQAVLAIDAEEALCLASAGEGAEDQTPGLQGLYAVPLDGSGPRQLHRGAVLDAVRGGEVAVLSGAHLDRPGQWTEVRRGEQRLAVVTSYAETPVLTTRPEFRLAGARRIPAAVVLPSGYDRERDGLLPVLMDPYGGPGAARVVQAHNAFLTSQWFADQGFAVVVADGRGTPGRSPAWEKAIAFDFAGATLDDQVEALRSLAEEFPLDLGRVAIRGWSYGGYLSALAVLRRPDVFHAAVAGAPVTDWRLYDTHYTERYLGHPGERPEVYDANSLIADAPKLERPLMIVHGLADDNVVAAHTLRLSSALLAAGRPHTVLPLSGVTHMTPQEQVAENLLLLQVAFLRQSLGL